MITCTFEDGNKASLRHTVVDVIVLKDEQLLMVKRAAKLLNGGKWALVGGYVDRDENIEQAAKREVLEETGWQIKDLVLLRIIDRPTRKGEDRQNICFVFFATATEKTGEPDWESDEQKWIGWEELPAEDSIAFDHAETISVYRQYLKENTPLPIIG
jgi:8-oxo-dGTP diphosphatase